MDQEFHAGWIALRFLNDAKAGAKHFAAFRRSRSAPFPLPAAPIGRAARPMRWATRRTKKFYDIAARHSTTYYGQIARAKLGLPDLALSDSLTISPDAALAFQSLPETRAIGMLYDLGEADFARTLVSEFATALQVPDQLAMLGNLAVAHSDPRTALNVGKSALQRGFPLDRIAFPTGGIPTYQAVSDVEGAVVYGIARQESEFNHQIVSHAGARGLMQ